MTVIAIHQPQYLPYLGFFHKLAHCDLFVALDNVHFQKNGLQNRNRIKNSSGWQWLTVPVLHQSDQKIREVRINNKIRWAHKHRHAIKTSYGKAAYFDWVWSPLAATFDTEWESLAALDMHLTRLVCQLLGITTPIVIASTLAVGGSASDLLIDICRQLDADTYLSGLGGQRYMDLEKFAAAGIAVQWQQFEPPTYAQVFPDAGFEPNLSILDSLMSCGPDAQQWVQA